MEDRNTDKEKTDSEDHDRVAKLLDEIKAMEESIVDTEILIEPLDQSLDTFEIPIETEISGEETESEIEVTSDKERESQKEIESHTTSEKEDKSKKKGFLYKIKRIKIGKPKHKKSTDKKRGKKKFLSKSPKKLVENKATFTLKLDETGNLTGFSIKKPVEERWYIPFIKKSKESSSESRESTGKIQQLFYKIKPIIGKIKGIIPHK